MPILTSAKALLLACAKAIAPPLLRQGRRLRAQRQAASGVELPSTDRIAASLDETIGALTGRANKPSWWPNAIAKMQQAGINPDPIFRGESLSPWLDDPQVRQCLRALAPAFSSAKDSAACRMRMNTSSGEAERNEFPGGRCYVAMAIPGTLSFGPLTNRTLHLCIDMQNLFAEATPWHTPWMARVLPVVEAIAASHAERTVFTRFVPPVKADEMPGTWRRYYQRWRDLTLERLDPRLIDLVPELARLVPPALVIDKHVYSPFPPATTASRESSRLARSPLPCGGAVQHDRREPAA